MQGYIPLTRSLTCVLERFFILNQIYSYMMYLPKNLVIYCLNSTTIYLLLTINSSYFVLKLLVKSIFTAWKIDILTFWYREAYKLNFPSNELVHNYFWMILVTFYGTFQDLLEARGGSIFQNTAMIASDTRFHFCNFFLFTVKLWRGSTKMDQIEFFILALFIRSLKNTFLKHFNKTGFRQNCLL